MYRTLYLFIYLFIHSFIHPSIHLFVHTCVSHVQYMIKLQWKSWILLDCT